jgi:hypothetical protein
MVDANLEVARTDRPPGLALAAVGSFLVGSGGQQQRE